MSKTIQPTTIATYGQEIADSIQSIVVQVQSKSLYDLFLWWVLPKVYGVCFVAALGVVFLAMILGLLDITYSVCDSIATIVVKGSITFILLTLLIVGILACIIICGFIILWLVLANCYSPKK